MKKKPVLVPEVATDSDDILSEVKQHYNDWTEDNQIRQTRKNGWDAITDAYMGVLPPNFPYQSKVVDPRIKTALIEKNARLINSKLRGRLAPRENGDMLKAKIFNAVLDFQWDNAKEGGTMLSKIAVSDMDSRMYGSKFGLVLWKYECDSEGKVIFNGNEYKPLDIRDCGIDYTADNVRNAKWFQVREWVKVEDLERVNNLSTDPDDLPYKNVDRLKTLIAEGGQQPRRDTRYQSKTLQNKGLTDRMGTDKSFPVAELVTEYRTDRWITFSPYGVVLRDIPNPYKHGRIPVAQLCYYPIQGDPIGESEIEPVLPIWRGIQAILNGFIDSYNININPPLKMVESQFRLETIVYGPQAQWLVNRQDAIEVMQSDGKAMNYFQTAYLSLVSSFNTAMGETSAGVSNIDPTQNQRTATEIEKSSAQQNTRDQRNQQILSEFIQDIMSIWMSNDRQFLFLDKEMEPYILRIIGSDMYKYFQRAGLDEMEVSNEAMSAIGDIVQGLEGNMSDMDINELMDAGKMPKYPVVMKGKNGKKEVTPKMTMNESGDQGTLHIVPEDLEGDYDYIADVKSMSAGALKEAMDGRQKALTLIQDPTIQGMLQADGVKIDVKELLVEIFEDVGMNDAERFFTKQDQMQVDPATGQPMQGGEQPMTPQIDPATGQPMPDMSDPMAEAQMTGDITQDMINQGQSLDESQQMGIQ